jgi:hypothetical protein
MFIALTQQQVHVAAEAYLHLCLGLRLSISTGNGEIEPPLHHDNRLFHSFTLCNLRYEQHRRTRKLMAFSRQGICADMNERGVCY